MDEIAAFYPTNVTIAKIDASKATQTASIHEVNVFPTIKYYQNGQFGLYTGDRTFDEISIFIKRFHGMDRFIYLLFNAWPPVGAGVRTVTSESELSQYLEEIRLAFVLSIDPNSKFSSDIHQDFISSAERMKIQANFIIFERIGPTSIQKIEANRNPLSLQIGEALVKKNVTSKCFE